MIKYYNAYGKVSLTNDYFEALVGNAATSCYGVTGMATANTGDSVKSFLFSAPQQDKGVLVREENGELIIDLHIKVTYGVSIQAITQSITNKVRYTIEKATGLKVRKINVYIDDIVAI